MHNLCYIIVENRVLWKEEHIKKKKKKLEQLNSKFKELIKKSKEKKLIKSHVVAFQEVPVKEEKHQGNPKYFCN